MNTLQSTVHCLVREAVRSRATEDVEDDSEFQEWDIILKVWSIDNSTIEDIKSFIDDNLDTSYGGITAKIVSIQRAA